MIQSNYNKGLEEKIERYINGELNIEQVDELWVELIQDEYYLDYMKSVANLKEIILTKRAQAAKPKVLPLRRYASYAAAVATLLIVSVIGVMNYQSSFDTRLDQPIQLNNESVKPISDISLDVVRAAEDPTAIVNEVVKRAIKLASEGNAAEAILLLQNEIEITTQPVTIAELALSLGSIQYNHGDYKASITNFKKVISQEGISVITREKGYYFLGNAHFQLNELAEAENAFMEAYTLDGSYSRAAKRYVDALGALAR
ncbi:MAG: hypothetical protein WC967_14025 [Balneolaceae bacterium]